MTADLPDMTGYPLGQAQDELREAGCQSIEVSRVGPQADEDGTRRTMVIRQRPDENGGVELTVAAEWRTPMRQDA